MTTMGVINKGDTRSFRLELICDMFCTLSHCCVGTVGPAIQVFLELYGVVSLTN